MTNEQKTIQELQAEVEELRKALSNEEYVSSHYSKQKENLVTTQRGLGFYFQERALCYEERTDEYEAAAMQGDAIIGALRGLGMHDMVKDIDSLSES